MIVRDEAAVVGPCLESVRDLIDTWVVCDTGSTDGTQDVIRTALAGIPGELHERPWVDFGHNRSELLALARGRADHLLLLDADWEVEAQPGALGALAADAYMIRHAGDVEFHNKRIVSGALDWRYVGATHEYILSEEERSCERLAGVTIHVRSVGGERTARWARDAELLEAALERDPGDARSAFYLAQTYRDMAGGDRGLLERALAGYLRRAEMAGWDEETHCALKQAGDLHDALGDWPAAQDAYLRAWELRPARLEPVYALSAGLRTRDRPLAAHRFASIAAGAAPLPVPEDDLFVAPWIYRWGLLFEYSITSWWAGEFDASLAACDRLAKMRDLPDAVRLQNRRNRLLAVQRRVAHLAEPALQHAETR